GRRRARNHVRRERGNLSRPGESVLRGFSVPAGKVAANTVEPALLDSSCGSDPTIKEKRPSDMTNHPRYSPPPQQPGYRPAPSPTGPVPTHTGAVPTRSGAVPT